MCIQVIPYVIIWSNLLANRVFKILEAVVCVSPALMNVTKETFFKKREMCSLLWAECLKNVLPFSSYGTGYPKYSKWMVHQSTKYQETK